MGLRGGVAPSLSWIARLNKWCSGNNLNFDLQKMSANCWYFRETSIRLGVFSVRCAARPFRDKDCSWVVSEVALGRASEVRAVSWFFKAGNCKVPVFQLIFGLYSTDQLCLSTTG